MPRLRRRKPCQDGGDRSGTETEHGAKGDAVRQQVRQKLPVFEKLPSQGVNQYEYGKLWSRIHCLPSRTATPTRAGRKRSSSQRGKYKGHRTNRLRYLEIRRSRYLRKSSIEYSRRRTTRSTTSAPGRAGQQRVPQTAR